MRWRVRVDTCSNSAASGSVSKRRVSVSLSIRDFQGPLHEQCQCHCSITRNRLFSLKIPAGCFPTMVQNWTVAKTQNMPGAAGRLMRAGSSWRLLRSGSYPARLTEKLSRTTHSCLLLVEDFTGAPGIVSTERSHGFLESVGANNFHQQLAAL